MNEAADRIEEVAEWIESQPSPANIETEAKQANSADDSVWTPAVVRQLKLHQRKLAEGINESPDHEVSIDDFADAVGWEHPFDNAAKNLIVRLNKSLEKLGSSRFVRRCDNRFQAKEPE